MAKVTKLFIIFFFYFYISNKNAISLQLQFLLILYLCFYAGSLSGIHCVKVILL